MPLTRILHRAGNVQELLHLSSHPSVDALEADIWVMNGRLFAHHERPVGRFLLGTLLGMTVLAKSDPRSEAAADMVRVALQALRPAVAKRNSGTRNQKRPAGVARPGRRSK